MSATTETPAGADERPRLLLRESIAKNLILGEIVEENLFPYPAIRTRPTVRSRTGAASGLAGSLMTSSSTPWRSRVAGG